MSKRELAGFLRHRRAALLPHQVGLRDGAGRARRTPGLRREEVAWLAGVSANYYERLEQARAPRPSPQVLRALAVALRLSDTERIYLARLADQAPRAGTGSGSGSGSAGELPHSVRALLGRLGSIPAYVVNPEQDIVAWNAMAAALLMDFSALPAAERNVLRLSMRYGERLCSAPPEQRDGFARQAAAELRTARVRDDATSDLDGLVDEFVAHSPEFADAWAAHDVRERPLLRKYIEHAELGTIEVDLQTLLVPGHELRLILCTADPDSPSAAKLALLAQAADGTAADPGHHPRWERHSGVWTG